MTRPTESTEPTHHLRAPRGGLFGLVLVTVLAFAYLGVNGCQRQEPTRTVEAYCNQARAVVGFDTALGDLDPAATADAFTKLEELAKVAPTEIESQVRTLVEASRPLVEALGTAPADDGAALTDVWRSKQADIARIQEAGRAVEAYTKANCNFDLATTLPPRSTTTAPASTTTAKPGPAAAPKASVSTTSATPSTTKAR